MEYECTRVYVSVLAEGRVCIHLLLQRYAYLLAKEYEYIVDIIIIIQGK